MHLYSYKVVVCTNVISDPNPMVNISEVTNTYSYIMGKIKTKDLCKCSLSVRIRIYLTLHFYSLYCKQDVYNKY